MTVQITSLRGVGSPLGVFGGVYQTVRPYTTVGDAAEYAYKKLKANIENAEEEKKKNPIYDPSSVASWIEQMKVHGRDPENFRKHWNEMRVQAAEEAESLMWQYALVGLNVQGSGGQSLRSLQYAERGALTNVRSSLGRALDKLQSRLSFPTIKKVSPARGPSAGNGGAPATINIYTSPKQPLSLEAKQKLREELEFLLKNGAPDKQQMAREMLAQLAACFAAGTPLLTPYGSQPVESFKPGDLLLSRDEGTPEGPVEIKAVEEVFVRTGRVLNLHIGGQVIRTTPEHPFWVRGKGWVEAGGLVAGDALVGYDGQWVTVEEVYDTGEYETVYNLRVADFHTYFVGCDQWGFSVWAHNADCARFQWRGNQWAVLDRDGKIVSLGASQKEALEAARGKILDDDYFALDVQRQLHGSLKPEGYLADAGGHLNSLGKDALGKGYPGKTIGGGPTHAHHIVMQEGSGAAGKAAVEESQAILRKHGIDPFRGQENLVWAPNNGYLRKDEYAQKVLERLKGAKQTKEGITKALKDIAEIVSQGKELP